MTIEQHKIAYLKESWTTLMKSSMFGGHAGLERIYVRDTLFALYSDTRRKYHNLNHIWYCLTTLDQWAPTKISGISSIDTIKAAIWFHDAFYTGAAGHDEEMSQKLLISMFPETFKNMSDVTRLIALTAMHGNQSMMLDDMAKIFLDIDMSILASESVAYKEYSESIIAEYSSFYPKIDISFIKAGRKDFLIKMLASERILFDVRLNTIALENIQRELDTM